MFASSAMPVERPAELRSNSYHNTSRSAYNSPAASRTGSVSSIASARTDPGVFSDHSRQSSASSTASISSSKSGFRSLFGKKDKKPKDKKDVQQLVLTSRHAAAVKTKLMMDPQYKNLPHVKTAGITQSVNSRHSSAAEQEARHPHSGPPALHPKDDMPLLTRIVSGDECDEEDELDRLERARVEWDLAKTPGFSKIKEHESDESATTSAEVSDEEGDNTPSVPSGQLSPSIERTVPGLEAKRPLVVTKNSYGGRFHKDEGGHWRR